MSEISIPSLSNVIFSTQLDIRISDINYGNHLGHDALISLLHEARVRFLKHHQFTELNIAGIGIIITHLAVNYTSEAFYADTISIKIGIEKIGKTSVDLLYQVVNTKNDKEIARAITTMAFFNYAQRKLSKIPTEFLSAIKASP